MSTAEAYYREVKGLSVEESPILGREHHIAIELLEDYHRGMMQVKNNDLLHDVSKCEAIFEQNAKLTQEEIEEDCRNIPN